jgi:hypothetical protein
MSMQTGEDLKSEQRRQHIEELKARIDQISGTRDSSHISPDCPDEITEKFLEHVLAFEETPQRSLFEALRRNGIVLPPPECLDESEVNSKLWEVIFGMSLLGHYLYNTDHLSDPDLYRCLWTEILPEPTTLMPQNPKFACHIDLVGSGSEEHIQLYLKYYADEEARRDWARTWPEDLIPPHQDPPYNRDYRLPQYEW